MKTQNRSFLCMRFTIKAVLLIITLNVLAIQLAQAVDCSGTPVWNSTTAYVLGNQVQSNGTKYQAKWWTQGQDPASNSGSSDPWQNLGVCNGSGDGDGDGDGDGTALSNNVAITISGAQNAETSYFINVPSGSSNLTIATSGGTGDADLYTKFGSAPTTSSYDCRPYKTGNTESCSVTSPATGRYHIMLRGYSAYSGVSLKASYTAGSSGDGDGDGDMPLPTHTLIGYWHNFNNGSGLYRISQVSSTWDVIVVAFADDAGNGSVAFNLDSGLNKAQFISDIAAKRAQGKKVILSFGGQNGTVTLNNATNVTNFVNSTEAIINEYGFNGIDIDLESGAGVTQGAPVINNLITAVKQLKARIGSGFYLSMAPEHPYVQGGYVAYGGIWGAYIPIINGLRNELTVLHVQLYNNGGLSTPYSTSAYAAGSVDMMVASARMLIKGFTLADGSAFQGLRADQVALGLPSGPSSAGSGQATTGDINRALDCITRGTNCGSINTDGVHPTFRGVMTWSINWDIKDGFIFSGPVGSKVHSLP